MRMLPFELILALVLVDLPVDLDSKDVVKARNDRGESWWYLVCESDDHFVNVTKEVVAMCSYAQVRALCFMENNNGEPLVGRATPHCQAILQRSLRFLGRYEFVGPSALFADPSRGIKIFEALDFGADESNHLGKNVTLRCYASEDTFLDEVSVLSLSDP